MAKLKELVDKRLDELDIIALAESADRLIIKPSGKKDRYTATTYNRPEKKGDDDGK